MGADAGEASGNGEGLSDAVISMRSRPGGRRSRRALAAANMLDEVVNSQLALLAGLPERSRRRSANYLAELVMLAQAYRHYANGWLDRKELDRRSRVALSKLDNFRGPHLSAAQVIEQAEQD
jgi:hypothetical protein